MLIFVCSHISFLWKCIEFVIMILLLPMNKNHFIILLLWEYNYLLCINTINHLRQYHIISLQVFSCCVICCNVSFTNFVTNDLTVFIVSVLLIFFDYFAMTGIKSVVAIIWFYFVVTTLLYCDNLAVIL